MKFDLIIKGRDTLSLGGLRRRRTGVMIDGQARFGGERVRVSWSEARQLIGAGQAEAAPGVVVPLTNPEPRP
ncbi:hypothetical protein GL279_18730 [Paracoccus limosus]|uniref:Uncharacterized protein n=1 Tax=Paracoccus limosus TaxID=913252 RepID=A0A844HBB7_9RHOB|nr:hypothetical protein [Paracoccus limosus]MTH36617.1 hypothetical protein [Paracoccus limosus]